MGRDEVDRKEKGVASSSQPTLTPEGPIRTNVTEGKLEDRERREDGWKVGNLTRKLEMPVVNGEDPDG